MLVNINNSFSIFHEDDFCIWMDPWLEAANYGSWAALYNINEFENFIKCNPYPLPDLVYISHLHTDHYDVDFLKFLKRYLNLVIVIKDFKDGRLKKKITEEVGPSEIICLNEYASYEFKSANLMIVPQISASSADAENQLEYDLDTSLIIETQETILFNEVDNPLHIEDYRGLVIPLSKWNNNSPKTKIGLIGYSGASDYPQSYLGIDRKRERKQVIDRTVNRFWEVTNLLNLDYVFPAGGTFILDGVLNQLNDFAPIPNYLEVEEKSWGNCKLVNPEKNILKKSENGWYACERLDKLRRLPSVNETRSFFANRDYDETIRNELHILKSDVEQAMPDKVLNMFKNLKSQIKFILYEEDPDFEKIERCNQKTCDELYVFQEFSQDKVILLEIHMHWEMLQKMLKANLIWNELTFHCVYNRLPNKYEPDAVFALNLYKKFKG